MFSSIFFQYLSIRWTLNIYPCRQSKTRIVSVANLPLFPTVPIWKKVISSLLLSIFVWDQHFYFFIFPTKTCARLYFIKYIITNYILPTHSCKEKGILFVYIQIPENQMVAPLSCDRSNPSFDKLLSYLPPAYVTDTTWTSSRALYQRIRGDLGPIYFGAPLGQLDY